MIIAADLSAYRNFLTTKPKDGYKHQNQSIPARLTTHFMLNVQNLSPWETTVMGEVKNFRGADDPPIDPEWSYDLNDELDRYTKALNGEGTDLESFVANEIMSRLADPTVPEPEHELMRRAGQNFFMLCKIIGGRQSVPDSEL